jgi:hypothetical protein
VTRVVLVAGSATTGTATALLWSSPAAAAPLGFDRPGSSELSSVFKSECRYRTVELDPLTFKGGLQSRHAELKRLSGGSL